MKPSTGMTITQPVISTPDLRLRPFRRGDADWVYYVSLDPELRRNLSLPDPYHYAHARYYVDNIAVPAHATGLGAEFVIEDRDTEIALGRVGFLREAGGELATGYWLAADARGRGLMARALRAACRWALAAPPQGLGVASLYWEAYTHNAPSRAVAERVGYTIHPGTVPGRHGPKWAAHLEPAGLTGSP